MDWRPLALVVAFTFSTASLVTIAPSAKAQNLTLWHLYGDTAAGWGSTSTTITRPGPTVTVDANVEITFLLHGEDTQPHTFYVDLNDNDNPDDPISTQFTGAGPLDHRQTFPSAGSFTYRCSIHPGTMFGTITIVGQAAQGILGLPLLVVVGIAIAVVVVLALAAVFMMRRKGPPQ